MQLKQLTDLLPVYTRQPWSYPHCTKAARNTKALAEQGPSQLQHTVCHSTPKHAVPNTEPTWEDTRCDGELTSHLSCTGTSMCPIPARGLMGHGASKARQLHNTPLGLLCPTRTLHCSALNRAKKEKKEREGFSQVQTPQSSAGKLAQQCIYHRSSGKGCGCTILVERFCGKV